MNASPSAERLLAAIDATWPPAEIRAADGWLLRRGAGGGKRVSAASAGRPGAVPEIDAAVAGLAAWGQGPLFRLSPGEEALDAALEARGLAVVDPTVVHVAPVVSLTDDRDETARVIRASTPIALVEEIWAAGGIGPGRLAVMARAAGPRITLIARIGDRPVGVGFIACDGAVAMLHAVEVLAAARRRGAGEMLLRGAANWAAEQGAEVLALAVTEANAPARALYAKLGMGVAARYHYRAG
ncbi:GNAT family N-acetyltransferase [Paralimibaculum aggregatum]|uniref:GNAT family N-acetyltransferase n=1 Tax=Paralimibaculum aggregatum TaxID=3036245 RepID=A0ABQ6LR50_9RHOB|nr:GNAT family N-acetyltransferase [Limibaculum sp. NKW23]GMG84328.1 GNAT family N-acetyltransferase [Limibaculum sp. NKW23]